MPKKYPISELDRWDALIASLSGIAALAIYVRTMAPDILYGDSAELQTQTYLFGHTHPSGYPIYLVLARLVALVPLNNPAWRVSLFSVLMATLAIGGVYLLSRMLTNSRVAALLATIGLALSYTFWSQAIIADQIVPGVAFLTWIYLLALHWQENIEKREWSLFAAALLAGLSLGVHPTVAISAVPAAGLVLFRLIFQRADRFKWRRTLLAGMSGVFLGVILVMAAFLFIDGHNTTSNFFNAVYYPSRSIWDLSLEDMDTPLERIFIMQSSIQWKDVLFTGGEASRQSLADYFSGVIGREFSVLFMLLGLYGWSTLLSRSPWRGAYLLISYGLILFITLNFHSSQDVYFLPSYIPYVAAAAVGMGSLIEGPTQWKFISDRGWSQILTISMGFLLLVVMMRPALAERLPTIQTGVASFVQDEYHFPVSDLDEPRVYAQMHLRTLPDNALVLIGWRRLWPMAYVAYVENEKPSISLVEAMPHGNDGKVAASMVETIQQALAEGRPVYSSQQFPGLEENFRLVTEANQFIQILAKE